MKFADLPMELRQRDPAPVYGVIGEEDYLRDRAVDLIRLRSHGSAQDSGPVDAFNDLVFYGDETDGAEILTAAREAPMFASRRVVVVKAAEKLPPRESEPLLDYLNTPCDSTTLIFSSHKLDGRQKFPQALKEKAVVVECAPLPEYQLPAWIVAEAGHLGIKLNDDAIALLKDVAGGSLYVLRQELEKLAAFLPKAGVAGAAEVELVRGTLPGASVFDLTEAISVGDRGRALYILTRNLEAGEAPLRILGSLVWQYRRLWKANELTAQGSGEGQLAKALAMPPYRVREVVSQARRFSPTILRTGFGRFLKADSDLKGGSAGASARVLETLLLALCADVPSKDGRSGARPAAPKPGKTGTTPISNVRTVRSGRSSGR